MNSSLLAVETMHNKQCKYKGKWSNGNKCIAYVYIFYLGYEDYYKIGFSKNVNKRFKSLNALAPHSKIVFKCKVGHAKREEDFLHKLFVHRWVKREVFKLSGEDVNKAKSYLLSKQFKESVAEIPFKESLNEKEQKGIAEKMCKRLNEINEKLS